MRHILIAATLALAACTQSSTSEFALPPELVASFDPIILSGEITRADHQTYKEIPFIVPHGTTRITVDFTYDKENRTVIDLGLRDPQGQRGWSGGNKASFTIGQYDATPSYQPGFIQPGEWKLVLGIPNIREGQTASYTATIRLDRMEEHRVHDDFLAQPVPDVLPPAAGWFRGDFHMHTAHSDGSCEAGGARGPCPPERTFEAARDAKLDFAAITDHNTITQLGAIKGWQERYPKTLLIPGMEVTTFYGHANAIGVTDFVDFQLGSQRLPTLAKLFDELNAQGAILSINHPALPSGEVCMGCGWTAKDTDWSRVTAIEVINGSTLRTGGAEGPTSGIRFWDNLLKQGYRLTAIGGSDNHDATDRTGAKQAPIGTPTTVVYASELSTKAIIEGVKSGRAFIDIAGPPGATLDMEGHAGTQSVNMGGELRLADDDEASIIVTQSGRDGAGGAMALVSNNLIVSEPGIPRTSPTADRRSLGVTIRFKPGATSGYIRPEFRDASGKLLLLGNPIYVRSK